MRETGVGVLDKSMAILEAFGPDDRSLTPQEIARRIGVTLPTVYRLVQAMAQHGLLDRDGSSFQLGHALLYYGMRVFDKIDLRRQALPFLTQLNDVSGENVHFAVRRNDSRVIVELLASPKNVRPFARVGDPLPLCAGAASEVLLAWLPESQALDLAAVSAARFGIEGTYDRAAFADRLRKAREGRVAISVGTRAPDISGIAAPVFGADGEVLAAVSLVVPTVRLGPEKQKELTPAVMEAAQQISASLGHREQLPHTV